MMAYVKDELRDSWDQLFDQLLATVDYLHLLFTCWRNTLRRYHERVDKSRQGYPTFTLDVKEFNIFRKQLKILQGLGDRLAKLQHESVVLNSFRSDGAGDAA